MRYASTVLAVVAVLTAAGAVAHADDTGITGTIVRLERNTPSADTYLQYHGRIVLKNVNGVLDEYRWGGASCGARILSDGEFASLQTAQNGKKMFIAPRSQTGQGNAVCLVGFSVIEKKNLSLFP